MKNHQEIERLEEKILYHKKKYYNGEPEISDQSYDQLEDKLRELDPNNPVLHLVGTPSGGKIEHDPEMLSAQKATSKEEVVDWAEKISFRSISAGYKVDGLSLSLQYRNGNLMQAATRGNGLRGDDVTPESMKIYGIPTKIDQKDNVIIRGEVYMKLSEFDRINSELKEEDKYASPRNLAAGTLKQKNLNILDERRLDFIAWHLVDDEYKIEEQMEIMKQWGFGVADFLFLNDTNGDELEQIFNDIASEREDLDFEIDGVIFKYNLPEDRKQAGKTEHHPKWSIAWKFQSEGDITRVKDITWQVGRTGVLTPVAEVEPVEISGATIRRVTLHNADILETLNVAVGDTVSIIRSGDVIPKIIDVVDKGDNNIEFPQKCPSCDSEVEKISVELVCKNPKCEDKNIEQILHWLKMTEMKGLGRKSVEKLFEEGIIRHYADFYDKDLDKEDLEDVLGKNGLKFYDQIEQTRELEFHIFLAALGIRELGPKMGKTLAKNYEDFDELQNTSVSELIKLEGISEKLAEYILDGVNDPNLGNRVLQKDIKIKYPIRVENGQLIYEEGIEFVESSRYSGKSLYITGKVDGFTKSELKDEVTKRKIEWKKSVSSNLDFLVYGDNPGPSKMEDARKKDVEILSWTEFNNSLDKPITKN